MVQQAALQMRSNSQTVNRYIPNVLDAVRDCRALGRSTCVRKSLYDPFGLENYNPTPAFPETDLAVWLKPHELGLADGTKVSTLPDSGNVGIDFIEASALAQPTYKVAVKNSLDVLWFPSSIIPIKLTQDGTFTITDAIGTTAFEYFAVFNLLTAPGSGQTPPLFESNFETFFMGFNDTPSAVAWHNDSGGADQVDSAISTSTWYLMEARHGSGTLTLSINGSEVDSTASGDYVPSGDNHLILGGGGASSDSVICYFAELLLYNDSLTSAERTVVRSYLNDKWSIY